MSSSSTSDAPRDAVAEARRELALVDADVHPVLPTDQLLARLPAAQRRRLERFGFRAPVPPSIYPRAANGGMRMDAFPGRPGALPGTDPEFLAHQLLDGYGIDYAVLNTLNLQESYETPDLDAAIARAVNDWVRDEWLERDARFLGSIVVPHEHPGLAVEEIERRAGERGWAQVLMPILSQGQLGLPRYWPIYEAASAHGLPIGFHSGGGNGAHGAHTGSGWPAFYFEEHVSFSSSMQGLLTGLVANGAFEAIPGLRVVLTEGGVAWLGPLRAALDDAWRRLGESVPRLTRPPSELIDERVWVTTQPIEEPADDAHLLALLAHANVLDRLLFASDYPHWDFDSPAQALPRALGPDARARILAANAAALYGLPRTR